MPWHIGGSDSCPVSKPFAVIKDSDGSTVGCHPTKTAAEKQLAALYASEKGTTMGAPGMNELERRYTSVPVELRTHGDKNKIAGYAARFNKRSRDLGGFVEQVAPSAFNKSRGDGWPDVIARYNHDDNMLLGTVGGNTLSLQIDEMGLLYEVDPPVARADILELVRRGDVRKSSFAFRISSEGDDWALSEFDTPLRTLVSVELVDVAPVNMPAYPDSSANVRDIALRSLAGHMQAALDDVKTLAATNELRKLFIRTDKTTGKPERPKMFGPAAAAALLARRLDPYVDE